VSLYCDTRLQSFARVFIAKYVINLKEDLSENRKPFFAQSGMAFILPTTLVPALEKYNKGDIKEAQREYLGPFQKDHGEIPLDERATVSMKSRPTMRRIVRVSNVPGDDIQEAYTGKQWTRASMPAELAKRKSNGRSVQYNWWNRPQLLEVLTKDDATKEGEHGDTGDKDVQMQDRGMQMEDVEDAEMEVGESDSMEM
jgi:hypothetical protein